MTNGNGLPGLNGNLKFILAALIPIAAVGVGWGVLQSDVNHIDSEVEEVRAEHQRDLDRIEDKLDQLIEMHMEGS